MKIVIREIGKTIIGAFVVSLFCAALVICVRGGV